MTTTTTTTTTTIYSANSIIAIDYYTIKSNYDFACGVLELFTSGLLRGKQHHFDAADLCNIICIKLVIPGLGTLISSTRTHHRKVDQKSFQLTNIFILSSQIMLNIFYMIVSKVMFKYYFANQVVRQTPAANLRIYQALAIVVCGQWPKYLVIT